MDFALNQKTAPKLGFDLAAELGCVGVEPRNDLGRPVFDGIEPARAGEMARERGLRFIGLSEVYPFNDWNEDRRAAVAGLIETAQAGRRLVIGRSSASSRRVVHRARQIIGPVSLEERAVVAVPTPDRPGLTDESRALQSNMDLITPIFAPFRDEAKVLK
jgi:hypothetical protein